MAVYILDTTITSLLEARHPPTVAQYQAHAADTILVTSNTVEECSTGGWRNFAEQEPTPSVHPPSAHL